MSISRWIIRLKACAICRLKGLSEANKNAYYSTFPMTTVFELFNVYYEIIKIANIKTVISPLILDIETSNIHHWKGLIFLYKNAYTFVLLKVSI